MPHAPPQHTHSPTECAFIKCYPEQMNEWQTEMKAEWTIIQVYNNCPHSNKRNFHSYKRNEIPFIGPTGLVLNELELYFGGEKRNSGLHDRPVKRRRHEWKKFSAAWRKDTIYKHLINAFWHPPNLDVEVSAETHEEMKKKEIYVSWCYSMPVTLRKSSGFHSHR